MELKLDLHMHSSFSYDSKMKVEEIIKRAIRKGLDGIAITDHETFKGAILAEKIAKEIDSKFIILKGEEIETEIGDIIGLFLKKEVKSRKFKEVVSEIKKQGGLVVLPHPGKYHKINNEVIKNVDLVEIFNSQLTDSANNIAKEIVKSNKKPFVAGSDAHNLFQIGRGVTKIKSKSLSEKDLKLALLEKNKEIIINKPNIILRFWIIFLKVWRKYVK